MPKVAPRLYKNFQPENYGLELDIDPDKLVFTGRVVITGKKVGPPAKRLVLHQKDLKVSYAEYPTEQARGELGALGAFGDRYGDTVKVYKMIADGAEKPFSFEICGGPHVDHTAQLKEDGKRFKILKEEASSAGVRRIKAMLV